MSADLVGERTLRGTRAEPLVIPPRSVVVPGSLPSKDGTYSLSCAVIVKRVDEKTRAKVGLNELLRSIDE